MRDDKGREIRNLPLGKLLHRSCGGQDDSSGANVALCRVSLAFFLVLKAKEKMTASLSCTEDERGGRGRASAYKDHGRDRRRDLAIS